MKIILRSFSILKINKQSLNFSFSGCGFLIPFHIGVAQILEENGLLSKTSKLAGTSGGAILAAAYTSGIAMNDILKYTNKIVQNCHKNGTVWKLEKFLNDMLTHKLPYDAYKSIKNRLIITTTRVWPSPSIIYIKEFTSNDHLRDAILTSSYIPLYLSPLPFKKFQNEFHIDGGIINIVPNIPGYVKICAFHAHILRKKDNVVSPTLLGNEFPFTFRKLLYFSLVPPNEKVMNCLYEMGKMAALKWIKLGGPEKFMNDLTNK